MIRLFKVPLFTRPAQQSPSHFNQHQQFASPNSFTLFTHRAHRHFQHPHALPFRQIRPYRCTAIVCTHVQGLTAQRHWKVRRRKEENMQPFSPWRACHHQKSPRNSHSATPTSGNPQSAPMCVWTGGWFGGLITLFHTSISHVKKLTSNVCVRVERACLCVCVMQICSVCMHTYVGASIKLNPELQVLN